MSDRDHRRPRIRVTRLDEDSFAAVVDVGRFEVGAVRESPLEAVALALERAVTLAEATS